MQSVSKRKIYEQTTSRIETPKCTKNNDGEINESDTENQIQGNLFSRQK